MSINKYSIANKEKTNKSFLIELSFFAFVFCFLFIFGSKFLANSIETNVSEKLQFQETGNVKYSVCLKSNNFFDDECLDSNMTYVASLIKSIPLTFNYQLNSNLVNTISSVDYEIVAKLVMENDETKAKYYNKEFVLVPKTTENTTNNGTLYNLKKMVDIDYEYYNNIANEFKSENGVETISSLNVSFTVYNESSELSMNPNTTTISIPLSQKSISIKMQSNDTSSNNKQQLTKYAFTLSNIVYLSFGLVSIILSIYFIIKAIRLYSKTFVKKTKYDKYLAKILREYDRLIVETSSLPNFNDYNIIKINKFTELLDVRDNLHLPIMYYTVVAHQKCHLYILKDNNLYLLTIKDVDM